LYGCQRLLPVIELVRKCVPSAIVTGSGSVVRLRASGARRITATRDASVAE
jgi:hypothetical protein